MGGRERDSERECAYHVVPQSDGRVGSVGGEEQLLREAGGVEKMEESEVGELEVRKGEMTCDT